MLFGEPVGSSKLAQPRYYVLQRSPYALIDHFWRQAQYSAARSRTRGLRSSHLMVDRAQRVRYFKFLRMLTARNTLTTRVR